MVIQTPVSVVILLTIFLLVRNADSHMSKCTDAGLAMAPHGFHAGKQEGSSVNLFYVRRINATGPSVILLHGWPQNWASWLEVMALLPVHYDVLAVNLRGVYPSDSPFEGYTKKVMAGDIQRLMNFLNISAAHIVGHDVGGMVAYAFSRMYSSRMKSFTIIDVPLPGTPQFDFISSDPRAWHFGFNAAEEFPEALTTGREAFFYPAFMREVEGKLGVLTPDQFKTTVDAYSRPSTARAGFEWYRAFSEDAQDNKEFAKEGKINTPVLALNAGLLSPGPYVLQMMSLLANDVRGQALPSGHWIPEHVPDQLVALLIDFITKNS